MNLKPIVLAVSLLGALPFAASAATIPVYTLPGTQTFHFTSGSPWQFELHNSLNGILDAALVLTDSNPNGRSYSVSLKDISSNTVLSTATGLQEGAQFNFTMSPLEEYMLTLTAGNGRFNYLDGSMTASLQITQPTPPISTVPLPAAIWLFGSALAGLGLFRRRLVARS